MHSSSSESKDDSTATCARCGNVLCQDFCAYLTWHGPKRASCGAVQKSADRQLLGPRHTFWRQHVCSRYVACRSPSPFHLPSQPLDAYTPPPKAAIVISRQPVAHSGVDHLASVMRWHCAVILVLLSACLTQSQQLLASGRIAGRYDPSTGLATLPLVIDWPSTRVWAAFENSNSIAVVIDAQPDFTAQVNVSMDFELDGLSDIHYITSADLPFTWSKQGLSLDTHDLQILKRSETLYGTLLLNNLTLAQSGRWDNISLVYRISLIDKFAAFLALGACDPYACDNRRSLCATHLTQQNLTISAQRLQFKLLPAAALRTLTNQRLQSFYQSACLLAVRGPCICVLKTSSAGSAQVHSATDPCRNHNWPKDHDCW